MLLALILCGLGCLAAEEVIEEIVAIVNDEVITLSEFKQHHDSVLQLLRSQLQGEEFEKQYDRMRSELLDSMITDRLLSQLAREKNLDVREQVKMYVENIKKENNLESDEDLRRALQSQGMKYEEWLKDMEESLLRQAAVFSEVDRTIVIDDSETVGYYKLHQKEFIEPEVYRLRAIYVKEEDKSKEEIEATKKEINEKIRAGEDFAALAGQYSEGPEKESQGDLGTFKKGELEKTLQQAVDRIDRGEITPWIQVRDGWYLLRLEEKTESRLLSFEEAKRSIEEKIFTEKKKRKLEEFLKELKKKSYIKILNPNPLHW